jgi:uncharacterized membrane protein YfcA
VLGTPSPAVTPTNLLYDVVATPGALYRYWRQGQTGGRLALVLIAGTLPGRGRNPGLRAPFPCPCLVHHHGSVAPDWPTGIALGAGGLAGAYTGARLQ